MKPILMLVATALVVISTAGCSESESEKLARSVNEQMAARKKELEQRQKRPMSREEFSNRIVDPLAPPRKRSPAGN
jgi:uncharacterized lipoprotein